MLNRRELPLVLLLVLPAACRSSTEAPLSFSEVDSADILVAAHRGFASIFPENTVIAFEAAFDQGADAIETDVRMTKDGVFVLMHDETVDRTTDGFGEVKSLTYAQIERLNACAKVYWGLLTCRVPTLRDALRAARGRGRIILELKEPFTAAQLQSFLDEVDSEGMRPYTMLESFYFTVLLRLHALDPTIQFGYLNYHLTPLDSLRQVNAGAAMPDQEALFADYDAARTYIREMADSKIDVIPWTVSNPSQARILVGLGIRHLISDVPLDKTKLY